jgi:hypothetical protein
MTDESNPTVITNPPDMLRMRGEVVGRFANLEAMLDGVIDLEYVTDRTKSEAFRHDVLADEGFSFALRRNVFRKILERRGWLDKKAKDLCQRLSELGNARNVFAHAGKIEIIDGKAGFLDPRKAGALLDFPALKEKFDTGCAEVEGLLLTVLAAISPFQEALRTEAIERRVAEMQAASEAAKRDIPGEGT